MPIILVLLLVVLLVVLLGPHWWVRHVLQRHGVERADLPGTGGELARHLLDLAGLHGVRVELTGDGDHYDAEDRTVRLLPEHHDGRSVAAVAIAAHEVSHAMQHANGEPSFALRFDLVRKVIWIDRIAIVLLSLAPIIAILARAPGLFLVELIAGFVLLMARVAVHVVTLPVELDASFGKALPVLQKGGYLGPADMPAARTVLRAAAFTYVASALMTLLNVARWFRILRF